MCYLTSSVGMRQHGKVSEVTEKKTAVYVDDQQRILIRQLARGWLWRSELPTTAADCDGLRRLVCLRGGLADAGTVSGHAAVDLVYRPVYVLTA